MSYRFRHTFRQDAATFVEDRGFPHIVAEGDELYGTLLAEFGEILEPGQTAVRSADGEGWDVVDGDSVTPVYVEPLAHHLRARRNGLLAQTDYMMMSDYPIEASRKVAVEVYRQSLRNLPEQDGWPFNVKWPVLSEG